MQVLDSTHSEVCHKVLERNTHMTSCYHELGSSVCPPLHQLVSVLHLFSFSTCTLTQTTTECVLCNIIIPVLLNLMVDSSDKPSGLSFSLKAVRQTLKNQDLWGRVAQQSMNYSKGVAKAGKGIANSLVPRLSPLRRESLGMRLCCECHMLKDIRLQMDSLLTVLLSASSFTAELNAA